MLMLFLKIRRLFMKNEILVFIKENYHKYSASKIAWTIYLMFGKKYNTSTIYHFARDLGLKKQVQKKWKDFEVDFVFENYKKMGDTEIAEILNKNKDKSKISSKRRVEKKRVQNNWNRTSEELKNIRLRNKKQKRFGRKKGYGKAEGFLFIWDSGAGPRKFIKLKLKTPTIDQKGNFKYYKNIPFARHLYLQHFGNIPAGHKIYFKDKNPFNCVIENLECKPAQRVIYKKRKTKIEKNQKWFISERDYFLEGKDKVLHKNRDGVEVRHLH